jgi:hypothetical protein
VREDDEPLRQLRRRISARKARVSSSIVHERAATAHAESEARKRQRASRERAASKGAVGGDPAGLASREAPAAAGTGQSPSSSVPVPPSHRLVGPCRARSGCRSGGRFRSRVHPSMVGFHLGGPL